MPDLICAFHKCRAVFEPSYAGQKYCCRQCKYGDRNWRKTIGERAMNAALSGAGYTGIIKAAVDEWTAAMKTPAPFIRGGAVVRGKNE